MVDFASSKVSVVLRKVMMKRLIQIQDREVQAEIQQDQNTITVTGLDKPYVFNARRTASGWILQTGSQTIPATLAYADQDTYTIALNQKECALTVQDPYQLAGGYHDTASKGDITAVMPGRVVKLMIAEGDKVEKNQPLLVLEAMKMENEIKSPVAGVIKDILVKEQDSVESGALLTRIELESNEAS